METLEQLDKDLLIFLNGINAEWLDTVMVLITGKLIWVPFYLLLVILLARKFGSKSLLIFIPLLILLVTTSDQVSVKLFKNVFERWRPCHNLEIRDQIAFINGCGGRFSFISSHACNTFAAAAFIAGVFKNRTAIYGMFIWAAIVSYSRVYLGVHYPSDIIAGAVVGTLIGFLYAKLFWYLSSLKMSNSIIKS